MFIITNFKFTKNVIHFFFLIFPIDIGKISLLTFKVSSTYKLQIMYYMGYMTFGLNFPPHKNVHNYTVVVHDNTI